MGQWIPWWGRIAAKLVLARLPAGYGVWRGLRVFRHGAMHEPRYALEVFRTHFAQARIALGAGFVALELGPGDSLASAVIAAAHGAVCTHLVDVGAFATENMRVYRDLCRYLRGQGLTPPRLEAVHDTAGLLAACHAIYSTRGLASLKEIRAASVDFAWSHAVLEHVRRRDFAEFVRESRRVIRDDGVWSHQIDLQDHLGGALDNLRIASRWWESEWMARSGFYTNRLRMTEIMREFERAGFAARIVRTTRWDSLPTPRSALAPEFRDLEMADLLVRSFAVELRPA